VAKNLSKWWIALIRTPQRVVYHRAGQRRRSSLNRVRVVIVRDEERHLAIFASPQKDAAAIYSNLQSAFTFT